MTTPRVTCHVSELSADQRFCTCCGKSLTSRFAWLELDQRTNTYHDFGGVPEDHSQGWFPFGLICARKCNARAKKDTFYYSEGIMSRLTPEQAEALQRCLRNDKRQHTAVVRSEDDLRLLQNAGAINAIVDHNTMNVQLTPWAWSRIC